MSSKQKQRKRNLQQKRALRITKGLKLESWEIWKEDGINVVRATDRYGIPVGARMYDLADQIPRTWKIRILVKCLAPDNTKYIEENELLAHEVRLNDLSDIYKEKLEDALNSVNSRHIVDTGWIATAL